MNCQRVGNVWVLLCLCMGCRHSGGPGTAVTVEQFGLEESARDHPVVSGAIAIASDVLSPAAKVALGAGWKQPPAGAVPVFAVTGTGLSQREIMTTYVECRCVIVQAEVLPAWLAKYQGSGESLLSVEVPLILAYMLLHEAGHIARGEAFKTGLDEASRRDSGGREEQKPLEAAADEFAADSIIAAMAEKGTARGLAASRIAVALAQLSWNLSAHRLLDDFGGTALRKRTLFQDAGLSHPNLEWRILRVNALISRTPAANSLLEQFENARSAGPMYRLLP